MHSEALAAGVLAANALRGEGPATEEPVAWPDEPEPWAEEPAAWAAAVPGVWAGVPTEPPATITSPPPTMPDGRPVAFPLASALRSSRRRCFALVLGNPFGAGGVESAISPTNSPAGSSRLGGPAGAGARARRRRNLRPSTGQPIRRIRRRPARSPGHPSDPASTPRPTAAVTPGPGATATPTPRPPHRERHRRPSLPQRQLRPQPLPRRRRRARRRHRHRHRRPPACTVPDLVGLTVAECPIDVGRRRLHRRVQPGEGPEQPHRRDTEPGGRRCLPPDTSVTVTTRLILRAAASPTPGILSTRAPVAQWIERWVPDPKVAGSSPVGRASATFSGSASADPCA